MPTHKSEYTDLIALTQLFLLREYLNSSSLPIPKENTSFFPPSRPKPLPIPLKFPPFKESKPQPSEPPLTPMPSLTLKPSVQNTPPARPPSLEKKTILEAILPTTPEKFSLEPLPKPPPAPQYGELREFFKTRYPHYPLQEEILENTSTRPVKNQRIPPSLLLLVWSENPEEAAFFNNLGAAISDRFIPVQMIPRATWENENEWNKWVNQTPKPYVVFLDKRILSLPWIQKEQQIKAIHSLHLEPASSYLRSPHLKKPLWNEICTLLSS